MVQVMKVPGKKAKCNLFFKSDSNLNSIIIAYEQMYARTMFLEKLEKISIDGTVYEITNTS